MAERLTLGHSIAKSLLKDISAGAVAQNASNLLWALSTMRYRPSADFSDRLQTILLDTLQKQPDKIHPQNIGDLVQALAVLRLQPKDGLLDACAAWMEGHVNLLLPNHILAYLNVRSFSTLSVSLACIHMLPMSDGRLANVIHMRGFACITIVVLLIHDINELCVQGLALMGILQQSKFLWYADKLRVNLGRPTEVEEQSYAYRIFVLAQLSSADAAGSDVSGLMTECDCVQTVSATLHTV